LAGIYIHIPFCRCKCHYCNFFSVASRKHKPAFLHALKKEIELTRDYLAGQPVHTVYFGGGTPSLYTPGELQEILGSLATLHPLSSALRPPYPLTLLLKEKGKSSAQRPASPPEITMEINPDDVTEAFVAGLRNTWFNRLSIGVQSFFEEDLKWLNRSHSAVQAIKAIKRLQEAGYTNISIDLIYGIPTLTDDHWEQNLEQAVSLKIPHISTYSLTVEPHTALDILINKGKLEKISEEGSIRHFKRMQYLREAGYLHYEISNFSLPGSESKHNSNYWKGEHYLGLGPSAHSFNGVSRQWNVASLNEYIAKTSAGESCFEMEQLTPDQRYNEYVMTSLRTMWGCDSQKIMDDFGYTVYGFFKNSALPFIEKELLREDKGIYYLTDEGQLFTDQVSSELFMV